MGQQQSTVYSLEKGANNADIKTSSKKKKGLWIVGKTKKITKDYILGSQIGEEGAFGYALRTKHKKTRREFATKVITKAHIRADDVDSFRKEVEIMKTLKHRNIINGVAAYEDKRKLYLVMELCTGGELFDRIVEEARRSNTAGAYSEAKAAAILKQLFEGIKYLHDNHIAHCDLKPSNFLFESDKPNSPVKIIDFGMSKYTDIRHELTEVCGTSYYMAPEVLNGKYTYHCDMWSMGVVMFVMLFGFAPFNGSDDEIKAAILEGFLPETRGGQGNWFPLEIPVSSDAKDLLANLLELDICCRYTADEALQHPWFNGGASTEPLVGGMMANLQSLTKSSQLKTTLLTAMSSATFSDNELQQLRKAFADMDRNGDGNVTISEMQQVLANTNDRKLQQNIQTLIQAGDLDGDGQLSYDEMLLSAVHRKLIAKEDRLRNMFAQLDVNGDGKVTPEEIASVLGQQSDLVEMIAEVDLDGDGTLDYEEFVEVFMTRERAEQKQ